MWLTKSVSFCLSKLLIFEVSIDLRHFATPCHATTSVCTTLPESALTFVEFMKLC